MNLNVSGHQLEVTAAIRGYVSIKLERVRRHFDHVIDAHVTLSTSKLGQKAEGTMHVSGREVHCTCAAPDLYAACSSRTGPALPRRWCTTACSTANALVRPDSGRAWPSRTAASRA